MSEWQSKSDFEINKAVAKLLCLKVSSEQFFNPKRAQSHCVLIEGGSKSVDYCNNPLDAWPLILKFGIDILSPSTNGTSDWFAGFFDPHSIAGAEDIKVYNKNPLRAAMIVYLEMNGVKP